eukprot:scaffold89716_cov66-Phaeocystis_antarctica.AAC.2
MVHTSSTRTQVGVVVDNVQVARGVLIDAEQLVYGIRDRAVPSRAGADRTETRGTLWRNSAAHQIEAGQSRQSPAHGVACDQEVGCRVATKCDHLPHAFLDAHRDGLVLVEEARVERHRAKSFFRDHPLVPLERGFALFFVLVERRAPRFQVRAHVSQRRGTAHRDDDVVLAVGVSVEAQPPFGVRAAVGDKLGAEHLAALSECSRDISNGCPISTFGNRGEISYVGLLLALNRISATIRSVCKLDTDQRLAPVARCQALGCLSVDTLTPFRDNHRGAAASLKVTGATRDAIPVGVFQRAERVTELVLKRFPPWGY